ncbi:MAG: hypothetical protein EZS28_048200 [Streblomastix strix]|uniref:Uncharacterized protein n=1 Tax=Streblomastix strix TaxID=222440 RepID=A0A5J4TD04_9EUKA|nr:MAG: hypothetical protein EZS28_048200 [Streblomastix strix]
MMMEKIMIGLVKNQPIGHTPGSSVPLTLYISLFLDCVGEMRTAAVCFSSIMIDTDRSISSFERRLLSDISPMLKKLIGVPVSPNAVVGLGLFEIQKKIFVCEWYLLVHYVLDCVILSFIQSSNTPIVYKYFF